MTQAKIMQLEATSSGQFSMFTPEGIRVGDYSSLASSLPDLLDRYGPDQVVSWQWRGNDAISFEPMSVAAFLRSKSMRNGKKPADIEAMIASARERGQEGASV